MTQASLNDRIEELRNGVWQADPTAYLVEARVMRRFLRKQSRHPSLAVVLPHRETQVASLQDVCSVILPDELGLNHPPTATSEVILLQLPSVDQMEHWPIEELKLLLWRRLFHASIDRQLKNLHAPEQLALVQARIDALGQVEFDEAHHVLRNELRLLYPDSRVEAFREWVAHYWEFHSFDPERIATWFPSIHQIDQIEFKMRMDLPIESILQQTKISGAASIDTLSREAQDETVLKNTQKGWSIELTQGTSERKYLWHMRRRDRSTERGNTVRSIISSLRAGRCAPSRSKRSKAESTAESDLRLLVKRLREAIGFPNSDSNQWHSVLMALSRNAIQGFWNSEKRLLYDLQKVCLDKERVSYRVDLLRWVSSFGSKPLRRPLYNLQEVQMAKHLASATARLVHVRLSGIEREKLTALLEQASHQADHQLRMRIRDPLRQTLLEVGMSPSSFPERVAMDKLVEDALDCISEKGYISMGYFRDAVSKNDLKLPDLGGLKEAWSGDRLLKADDRLDQVLDGVYRRGDFYLRWIQMISAMFFGTRKGRFATLFLIIPFGGALVLVESIRHVWHQIQTWTGTHSDEKHSTAHEDSAQEGNAEQTEQIVGQPQLPEESTSNESISKVPSDSLAFDAANPNPSGDDATARTWPSLDGFGLLEQGGNTETVSVPPKTTDQAVDQIVTNQLSIIPMVIVLGFFLMGLIHLPNFRVAIWKLLRWLGQLLYAICVRLPQELLPWDLIRTTLAHPWTQSVLAYAIKPGALVFLVKWLIWKVWPDTSNEYVRYACEVLVVSTLLNSRVGRDVQELVFESVSSVWSMLRLRWFVIAIDWIVEFFRTMLLAFERFLYAVDEWLRFHNQESVFSLTAKAILGFFWSVISFLIRIYINLLIEPTLHPVKHFPVVTVAHKIFLPALLILAVKMRAFLSNYMNEALAMSITSFNIVFLPGFFGFAVWELKENWRLFRQNRWKNLSAMPVGSHGETIERLLRPGFHSGTLPKLFRGLRRLENESASVKRFTKRRSCLKKLHHVVESVHRFVDRELLALVNQALDGESMRLICSEVKASTNSLSIHLDLTSSDDGIRANEPLELVIQEQSGWVVAWTRRTGWLDQAPERLQSAFDLALLGFLRKCGVFLVRRQVDQEFAKERPYDIQDHGLVVWSDHAFNEECFVRLEGSHVSSFRPSQLAKKLGLLDVPDHQWIFAASETTWAQWERDWQELIAKNQSKQSPSMSAANRLE
ncbi:MAG: hypothetical protein ACK42H_07870 [Planctomycetota bacterium]